MTQMTLEKARKLIMNARAWSVPEGLSDIAIARKLHESNKDLGYFVLGVSLGIMKCSSNTTWEIFGVIGGFLVLIWSLHLFNLSRSYGQIRELFESKCPQNLADLKSSPAEES